jgi:putative transposase
MVKKLLKDKVNLVTRNSSLRRELARVKKERDFLREAAVGSTHQRNVLRQEIRVKFLMIERCRDAFPVRMMCCLLSVSRSGYCAWACRAPSAQAATNDALLDEITDLHDDSDGVLGAPTITDELNMKGIKCSINRVARLMKSHGMQGIPKSVSGRRSIQRNGPVML